MVLYKFYVTQLTELTVAECDSRIPLDTKLKMVQLYDKAASSYAEYIEGLN